MVQSRVRFAFQSRIAPNGKSDFKSAFHADMDLAILMVRRDRLVNQCAQASVEL